MRILHTADWHLGRLLHGKSLVEDQAYVLEQLVALTQEADIDAVVIAGDVYDRAQPPVDAVRLLDQVLERLICEFQVPVIMVAGNHDSPDRLAYCSGILAGQGLHVHGQVGVEARIETLKDKAGPVHFCMLPFVEPAVARGVFEDSELKNHDQAMGASIERLRAALPKNERSVLVAHAFVQGGEASESERPLWVGGSGAVAEARFAGFDYVALGHLHRAQRVGEDRVRYAGSLLKYSFAEAAHEKSVSIVDMGKSGKMEVERVKLSPLHDLRRIEGCMDELLAGAAEDPAPDDYFEVRLMDPHPVLDAMGRLRLVYPNTMHIERPGLEPQGAGSAQAAGDHRKVGLAELFGEFYKERRGQEMDEARSALVAEVLEDMHRREREG